jgi:hypothetical protein
MPILGSCVSLGGRLPLQSQPSLVPHSSQYVLSRGISAPHFLQNFVVLVDEGAAYVVCDVMGLNVFFSFVLMVLGCLRLAED